MKNPLNNRGGSYDDSGADYGDVGGQRGYPEGYGEPDYRYADYGEHEGYGESDYETAPDNVDPYESQYGEGAHYDGGGYGHPEAASAGAFAGDYEGRRGKKQVEPSPDVDELASGVPYRAIAAVLLALVVIAVGVGLAQLIRGDDDKPAPSAAPGLSQSSAAPDQGAGAPAAPQQPEGAQQPPAETPKVEDSHQGEQAHQPGHVPVTVFNNSTISGLADDVAGRLRGDGVDVTKIGNYSETTEPASVVYYGDGPGEREEAERIAAKLGIEARARTPEVSQLPPGVVVVVAKDMEGR